ncbi:MAG: tRNA pseudouridine(38-40) synthase TruA [Cocleimonas sp.]
MKYAACIEYDGTDYRGWQRLKDLPSVQEEVEKALSHVANHSVELSCAGRTDSGVHGIGQIVHFESDATRDEKAWRMGCNTNLPDNIVLRWIQPIADDFHARFSARSRRYRYIILNHQIRPALLNKKVCWYREPLDEALMQNAANWLLGEHDFSSFRASGCQAKHAMRELQEIKISREGKYIYVDIIANAFLHHMVRNIVGSLFEVGTKRQEPEWFSTLLDIKDRTKAGITAPACGLYFVSVDYPAEYQLPEKFNAPFFAL